MKTTKTAIKIKNHIESYVEYYQECKGKMPPELVLSDYQVQHLDPRPNETIFGLRWRRYP